jgi:hypothetical protein
VTDRQLAERQVSERRLIELRVSSRLATVGVGVVLVAVSFVIYLLSARQFDAGRGDLFWLADAFLKGRTWLAGPLGPNDVVYGPSGQVFVPFAPFPAIAFMPLVAVIGPANADLWEPIINAAIAAADVGLAMWLAGRAGVRSIAGRVWLAVLLGFSTQIWWVTTRGGVWHTGHLIATFLTLAALIEVFGRRRSLLLGILAGAAFLTRAPLAFAVPLFLLVIPRPAVDPPAQPGPRGWLDPRTWPIEGWIGVAIGVLPAVAFFLWYNEVRFGSPLESGYALATLPPWLAIVRAEGLFSTSHLGMNLDYLLIHLPSTMPNPPYLRPDGLGMSIFLTSPGLLRAVRAPWRDPTVGRLGVGLALTALATLVPNLLYYGGGWLQFGYRYALDSIPFVLALAAMATARHGFGWPWRALTIFGALVGIGSVYWAYHL